jgi:Tfp pilus assembly protein PilN
MAEVTELITTPSVTPSDTRTVAVPSWRRMLLFGTGFGIAISNGDLEAVIVRSRSTGPTVIGSTSIRNFQSRPAAEWGSELLRFLAAAGESQLAATVVLPREEVIVRTVRLPGVAEKDTASAIELQLDTLHPWDEEPVEWAWWRVTPLDVVVGVMRRTTLDRYETLFSEAGIPMAAVTFSSAVIHAALRLQPSAPASIFCYVVPAPGRVEVYGETEAKPFYSAGYSLPAERALSVARGELRLQPDYPAVELSSALSSLDQSSGSSPISVAPVAYAAALAASAPFAAKFANLLPAARRASHSRTRYLVPAILGTLLLAGLLFVFVLFPFFNERRYVRDLLAEESRLEKPVLRVRAIDKSLVDHRARITALDDFRSRTQADLDLMNELARILPQQVWTNTIDISPDSVTLDGEADQAAPLLKVLDSSPFFEKSEFSMSVGRSGQTEHFRIKTMRRGRAGRTTP